MCGRSSLTKTEKDLEERFNATFYTEDLERYNPLPNFNVCPTHILPIIRNDDLIHFQPSRWGLIPSWAKDEKFGFRTINARKESLFEKAAYKTAIHQRRCVIPMDGFYEWKKVNKEKQPYRIITTDQDIFLFAGLWDRWKNPDGQWIISHTVITQEPSPSIAHIHDRMPVILQKDQEKLWLDMELPAKDAVELLQPYPDENLDAYRVSSKVNKVTQNEPSLIEPIDLPEQSRLF